MRFRCGRGYQQTVLSIIRAKFSTHSFIPSRLVSTRCNANWPANVHHQYLKVLNASTCSFLLLANFSFEHSLKWKDQNMLLNVTHITMFGWELSKTNSLRWLHTLKASTAMLKLVHLPYSAQGLVCADLCHLDGFLCYCFSGFFFFYLSYRLYPCVFYSLVFCAWGANHTERVFAFHCTAFPLMYLYM